MTERLETLLRKTIPPTQTRAATRDIWPLLVDRLDERPRWSLVDVGLGMAAAVSFLFFPEWLWLLAYHL